MDNFPKQLAEILRAQIKSGELRPKQVIPSHVQLATKYGISVSSVKEGIDILKAEGLLVGRSGKGVFVAPAQKVTET